MFYDPDVILEGLGKVGQFHRISSDNLMVQCPFPHGFDGKKNPIYSDGTTLGISLDSGKWNCFSKCENRGSSLRSLFQKLGRDFPDIIKTIIKIDRKKLKVTTKEWTLEALRIYKDKANDYWGGRGISQDVISAYGLGCDVSGHIMHVPIIVANGEFVGWASRIEGSSFKWLMQPDGVSKKLLLFGKKMYDNELSIIVESIPDVLKANTFGYNAYATCGTNFFTYMAENILFLGDKFCLIPHNDAGGMKWAEGAVRGLRTKCTLFGVSLPSNYNDLCELPSDEEFKRILGYKKLI